MFTPTVQSEPRLIDGLGLQGFCECKIQPRFSCQNITRIFAAVLAGLLSLTCFVAGVVTVSTGVPVLFIIAGSMAIALSVLLGAVTAYWGCGAFLSCSQKSS